MTDEHLCLTDLLDQDVSSSEFFYSLSPQLQKTLLKKDISTFEELQKCAAQYRSKAAQEARNDFDYYNPACSATDCTGLIPTGSNRSYEDYNIYKEIYPFANPPHPDGK